MSTHGKITTPHLQQKKQNVDNTEDDDSYIDENNSEHIISTNQESVSSKVRRENKWIVVVRSLVITIALGATVLTAWLLYVLAAEAERQSFLADYTTSADTLVENFLSEIATRFFMASTLSSAITAIMEASQGADRINVTFPGDRWSVLTQEMRFRGYSTMVSYAPLVTDNKLRERLESHIASRNPQGVPPCFVCDSSDQFPLHPDKMLEVPGVASFICDDVWKGGLEGIIPADSCAFVVMLSKAACGCRDATDLERQRAREYMKRDGSGDLPKVVYSLKMNLTSNEAEAVPLVHANDNMAYHLPIATASVQNSVDIPILYDQATYQELKFSFDCVADSHLTVISPFHMRDNPYHRYFDPPREQDQLGYFVLSPVFSSEDDSEIIGVVSSDYRFQTFFRDAIPYSTTLLSVHLENTCGQTISTIPFNLRFGFYGLLAVDDLPELAYGAEDLAKFSSYEAFEEIVNIASIKPSVNSSNHAYCRYRIKILPTKALEDKFISNRPVYYAITSVAIFVFTASLFVLYDVLVKRRQTIIVDAANKTNDIVVSLFPPNVRDRLLDGIANEDGPNGKQSFKKSLNQFLVTGDASKFVTSGAIADLFPHVTVMFLDIQGFTAWSSERQPSQVYMLLEALYGAFDLYATRMKVFKVETVGDSYVAACGLPQENHRHAIVMAEFAMNCLQRMKLITRKLEAFLGPSTGDLKARVGLHSGIVCGGILRGDKARYQLFGDTVNTGARLEHLGEPMRIHCSQATADLLIAAGHADWVTQRDETLQVKGKGEMQTFWVEPAPTSSASLVSAQSSEPLESSVHYEDGDLSDFSDEEEREAFKETKLREHRLVEWNVEILYCLLKTITAHRQQRGVRDIESNNFDFPPTRPQPIEELTQVIKFPPFQGVAPQSEDQPLLEDVKPQLQNFVREISKMYRDVPFHNFSHASHVVMSASKLMKRIVDPNNVIEITGRPLDVETAKDIHDATYGLSSDPLMQFSVVFSALIHDVDHTGLTNAELMEMKASVAAEFQNKSIAEQNSIVLAWSALMKEEYKELRTCIFTTENERRRFRQYIVNAVLATDIADGNLKACRESRWDAAFASDSPPAGEKKELTSLDANRRATVIFEYIIQAADIAHCMQHWQTYQRFNERLFEERYVAWISGNAAKEPSAGWYQGELWFFVSGLALGTVQLPNSLSSLLQDNYIIPLAQKLKKCGVFGVSYYEFLTYAQSNRLEWQQKGQETVPKLLERCQKKYGKNEESYC